MTESEQNKLVERKYLDKVHLEDRFIKTGSEYLDAMLINEVIDHPNFPINVGLNT